MRQTPASSLAKSPDSGRWRAWWQLIRPPNLFTVPGDPLAGFVLAGVLAEQPPAWPAVLWPMLAALLLYAGGLIGNDLADEEEDRRDRPFRPIPSGRVSRRAARLAALGCGAAGLLCAAAAGWRTLLAALFTLAAILAYNGGLKRRLVAGSLAMGCCRGGSFLLGVLTVGWPEIAPGLIVAVAGGVTLYVAGVTAIAERETVAVRLGVRRWVPLAVVLGIGLALGWWLPLPAPTRLLLAGAAAWAGYQGWRLRGIPLPAQVPPAVGALIRGLLLVQAAVCALGGLSGAACAAALLVCWRLNAAVARRYYAS